MLAMSLQVAGAVKAGLLKPSDLDTALRRTYLMRFKTGQFDPPGSNPWSKLARSTVLQQPKHITLARTVAQKGVLHAPCYGWRQPLQYTMILCHDCLAVQLSRLPPMVQYLSSLVQPRFARSLCVCLKALPSSADSAASCLRLGCHLTIPRLRHRAAEELRAAAIGA
jgi:hypothetical protein